MQFLVFFVALPISLMGLTDAYIKKAAENKGNDLNKFLRPISSTIGLFVFGCLVWSGSFIMAAVWVFWMLAKIVSTEGVKKLREATEKSS